MHSSFRDWMRGLDDLELERRNARLAAFGWCGGFWSVIGCAVLALA